MFIPIDKDNLQKNFFCFFKFHMVCFEKKQKWKNLHELWTAPNLIVACLEFLWIDLMLDYVLQWKGIWYYRYDMACSLQFTEAGSLMGIGLHYYCDCPRIPMMFCLLFCYIGQLLLRNVCVNHSRLIKEIWW